jgi:valyl-tRNA synthetase
VEVSIHGATPRQKAALADVRVPTSRLAGIGALELEGEAAPGKEAAHRIVAGAVSVAVHLSGAARDRECARLKAELRDLDRRIEKTQNTLANRQFTSRAPAEVVEREREKERQCTTQRAALAARFAALGCD